jgi:hypothetical protein
MPTLLPYQKRHDGSRVNARPLQLLLCFSEQHLIPGK